MIAFSPDEWHAPTPAAPKPPRLAKDEEKSDVSLRKSYGARVIDLFKGAGKEWFRDRCPQLGAALAYYTVFSLAPLVIVLLGVFGLIYGSNEGTREKILEQLRYYLDPSGVKVIQDIATSAAQPTASVLATVIGALVALFGASCIFGQLQDALNTVWSIRPKPSRGLPASSGRVSYRLRWSAAFVSCYWCLSSSKARCMRYMTTYKRSFLEVITWG
jgi:hypothetical protein